MWLLDSNISQTVTVIFPLIVVKLQTFKTVHMEKSSQVNSFITVRCLRTELGFGAGSGCKQLGTEGIGYVKIGKCLEGVNFNISEIYTC